MAICPNCKKEIYNLTEEHHNTETQKAYLNDEGEVETEYLDTFDEKDFKYFCPLCEYCIGDEDFDVQEFLENDELKKIIKDRLKDDSVKNKKTD